MINLSTKQTTSHTDRSLRRTDVLKDEEILTPEALAFLQSLHDNFDERRKELLAKRQQRQEKHR